MRRPKTTSLTGRLIPAALARLPIQGELLTSTPGMAARAHAVNDPQNTLKV